MPWLRAVIVAAAAVTSSMVAYAVRAPVEAEEPSVPSFLAFAGTDMWREGAFLYGGSLWSPGGLDVGGFTLKVILDGGDYTYPSGGSRIDIDGTLLSGAALPGWRFTHDGMTVTAFVGPIVQDYRLTPDDPGGRLRGFYAGGQFAADVWYQPDAQTMAAFNGSIDSIGPNGYLRAALGTRVFDAAFVGPEVQGGWCADYYAQLRLGAHVTAWRLGGLEWSGGAGWAVDSDHRDGPYVRFGVNARY